MGAIMAKLDNSNKIDSLDIGIDYNLFNKNKITIDLNKMKDYINKYGYIKVELDQKQLETYINTYINKYFKHNEKEITQLSKSIGIVYSVGSLTLSNMGLFVITENNNTILKPDVTKPDVKKPDATKPNVTKPDATKPDVTKPDATKPNVTKPDATKPNVTKPDTIPAVSPDITKGQFFILLPKIYFSKDRDEFIDFISDQKDDSNINQKKVIFNIIRKLLDKINKTPNPEVKILNTIGLLVRFGLLIEFINIIQKNISKYSDDEKINLFVGILLENLEDIPYDECIFYNDKLNFLKFSPNICAQAKNDKIANLKKQYAILPETIYKMQECPNKPEPVPVHELESSNGWKYISSVLFIILVIMSLIIIFKSNNVQSDLSNLSKIK
jgi:hypothetical protein